MKLTLDPSVTYALALEGGGAKGAFQIGAWRALREAGIRLDAVAGTSVGALNGALIAMGNLEQAEEIWKNIRYSQIMDVDDKVMSDWIRGGSVKAAAQQLFQMLRDRGFDVTPLRQLVHETVDPGAVRSSPLELFIVTYSLSEQKELELRARDLGDQELEDMLLASAHLPVFRGERLGGKLYADGGVADVLPLHVLVENGYQRIIAPRVYGVGLERPVRIPRGTQVHVIDPSVELGNVLQFEPELAARNLLAGYYDTTRFLYGLAGKTCYIDARWDEETARGFLAGAAARFAPERSLRQIHERTLPALAGTLNVSGESYRDLAVAVLEWAAERSGAERFAIYTEEELLTAAGGEESLEGLFAEPSRRWSILPAGKAADMLPETGDRPALPEGGEDRGLRVCLMNDSFPPVVDGVANAVVNYAKELTRAGDFCAVATPEYPGVEDDYPFPVVRYPSVDTSKMVGYRAGNPFSPAAVETLSGMNFDLIHTHCPVASTILARTLRESVRVPVILTYHTKFDIDIAGAIKAPPIQQAAIKLLVDNISACDQVWVVSRGAGDNLRSLGFQGDYVVMPNGVDLARGRAPENAVDALSEKYDLPEDVPVFLFLGRMMWYKGLRLILDALARVRAAGKEFRMVFVGDGLEREEVIAYARELRLDDWCRFPGAERDREVIRAWYTRADLFLFPSTFDTNGLVVREAAACSLGSLLIEGSCAAEDITHGETGILVEENAESIAAALLAPEATRENFRRIGQTASEQIYLSWEDSVKNARRQYQEVLERFRAGELHRKRAPFDWFFERNNDAADALDWAKRMFDKYLN